MQTTVTTAEAYPRCTRCGDGTLVPLSDGGSATGGAAHYKAWACITPDCGYAVKLWNGSARVGVGTRPRRDPRRRSGRPESP